MIYKILRKEESHKGYEIAIFDNLEKAQKFVKKQQEKYGLLFSVTHTIVPWEVNKESKDSLDYHETPISKFLSSLRIRNLSELSRETSKYEAIGEAIQKNTPGQDEMYTLHELTYVYRENPDWIVYIHQSVSYGGLALVVGKETQERTMITLGEDDGWFFIDLTSLISKNDYVGSIMKVIGLYNDTDAK